MNADTNSSLSQGTNQTVLSYGSLGRRILAQFLDGLILAIPMAFASHIIPFLGGIVLLFFYAPILESSELKATLGKHLMGLQVVDSLGRRISLRAATIRNLLKIVSTVLLCIGFIFALFNEKKQTLHDLLADTFVIYGRSERPIFDTWMASAKELFNSNGAIFHADNSDSDTLTKLERLKALRDQGVLTEEEFQIQKKKIIS